MADNNERGYWLDPATGRVTPVPDAPYGYVFTPCERLDFPAETWGPRTEQSIRNGTIRPATKEEAEQSDA